MTRETFWQIEGLLTLAKRHVAILRQIELSLQELCGEKESGHCSDAIYEGYDAKTLLSKLDVKYPDLFAASDDDMDVYDLELSARAYNGLLNANVKTLGQLKQMRSRDFKRIKNFGIVSMREVEDALAKRGITIK